MDERRNGQGHARGVRPDRVKPLGKLARDAPVLQDLDQRAALQGGARAEIRQQRDAEGAGGRFPQHFAVVRREASAHRHRHALVSRARLERPGGGAAAAKIMQAIVARQIRRRARRAVLRQVFRGCDEDRARLADQRRDMRVGHAGDVPDGQIESFGGQRGQMITELQLDPDLGKALQEFRDQRRDDLAAQRHGSGHGQYAARPLREISHGGKTFFDALVGRSGMVDQAGPGFRQAHAAGRAAHQRHAGRLFQLHDTLAHRGLADLQAAGGRRVAPGIGQDSQAVNMRPKIFQASRFRHANFHCSKPQTLIPAFRSRRPAGDGRQWLLRHAMLEHRRKP